VTLVAYFEDMREMKLPPQSRWEMRSSGLLRSV